MNGYKKEYLNHPVYQRLMSPGPKRILALDGGGIRGALTIGYLERIEEILRNRFEKPSYKLHEYFDLIGGTSTGAIIATLLAKGKSVGEIKELYLRLGPAIFSQKRAPWILSNNLRYLFLSSDYKAKPLEDGLESHLTKTTLGSEELLTGLCVVARRADNYGTYGFNNHPGSNYYEDNKGIYLKDLVRASTAAPTYFKSKVLELGDDEIGVFVDGGVSSANNPALFLFMIATMERYGYNWHMGKDELLITSIGTGSYRPKIQMGDKVDLINRKSIQWAPELPNLFMADATSLNQDLLEFMANPGLSKHINERSKTVDMKTNFSDGAFTYKRYNIRLSKNNLQEIGFDIPEEKLVSMRKIDAGKNAEVLYNIGHASAQEIVCDEDFPSIFDFTKDHLEERVISDIVIKEKFITELRDIGQKYKKVKNVYARKAKVGETIVTITDRFKETINKAKEGDFIIQNQTSDGEKYLVSKDEFAKRYEIIKELDAGRLDCTPKGKVHAIQLTKDLLNKLKLPLHFFFIARWGKDQYAREGDYLACNMDFEDVYKIEKKIFYETYSLDK